MRKGGYGGARTQKAGAKFEQRTDQDFIEDFLSLGFSIGNVHRSGSNSGALSGISLKNDEGKIVEIFYQDGLYKLFFEPNGVKWKEHFSARLKPDTAIFSSEKKVLTIIEKKQQETEGSVAEKLQTCDYKLNYYNTLAKPLNVRVELVWLLGSYFERKSESLRSVYEYMISKGSKYYFHKIPLSEISF